MPGASKYDWELFQQSPDAIELVCSMVVDGYSRAEIAYHVGTTHRALLRWLNAQESRWAAVLEAQRHAAHTFDYKAEGLLKAAEDDRQLRQAKELAAHYRWRAERFDRQTYGNSSTQMLTVATPTLEFTPEQTRRMAELALESLS